MIVLFLTRYIIFSHLFRSFSSLACAKRCLHCRFVITIFQIWPTRLALFLSQKSTSLRYHPSFNISSDQLSSLKRCIIEHLIFACALKSLSRRNLVGPLSYIKILCGMYEIIFCDYDIMWTTTQSVQFWCYFVSPPLNWTHCTHWIIHIRLLIMVSTVHASHILPCNRCNSICFVKIGKCYLLPTLQLEQAQFSSYTTRPHFSL